MSALARRRERTTNIWPGFVDALATLLMVILFLLLIFVVAQFFLGQALSGRDAALRDLRAEVSELANLLALEKQTSAARQSQIDTLTNQLQASIAARDDLQIRLGELQLRAEAAEQQTVDAMVAQQAQQQAILDLRSDIKALEERSEAAVAALVDAEQKIEADRETIELKLSEIAKLNADIQALNALKQDLINKVLELGKDSTEKGDKLLAEQELSESARAQVALLNQQLGALRQQLATLQKALELNEQDLEAKNIQIANLGARLNSALASKVQELNRYRSEFFGKLREVLGNRPGIRVVGDRFVFQSEVLFDVGSADLGAAGQPQLKSLAATLKDLTAQIPDDIDWVLRVDGHTDRTPIATVRFPSNWELSAARAISVVKFLLAEGVPADRLVAAGFGANRPIDPGNDEIALRRNRRIELKLTQR